MSYQKKILLKFYPRPWMLKAACVNVDPELFYPRAGQQACTSEQTQEAIAVCRRCPVIYDCLRWAFETGDKYAILGGKTPNQRTRIRREALHRRLIISEETGVPAVSRS